MNARTALTPAYHRYNLTLLLLFVLVWIALGWAPSYRADWALENAIVVLTVPWLVLGYRKLTLSRLSYSLLFLFMCLHQIGAHYTYAEVPYDRWWQTLSGQTLNAVLGWERNHFDRLVHFLYGLLVTYPIRELLLRVAVTRGFWGLFVPFMVVLATSAAFELIEWAAALLFGGDLGMAYLGTQGDIWDAHKDMALAAAGAGISLSLVLAVRWLLDRDFAREWSESLSVKDQRPLGEVAIADLMRRDEPDGGPEQ